MPLTMKVRTFLLMARVLGGKPMNQLSVAEARRAAQTPVPPRRTPTPIAAVLDRTMPGPAGDLPIRIYTPNGAGPFPLLMYFHSGGFVVGSVAGSDGICRALCHDAGYSVVSVDYRLGAGASISRRAR